LCHLIEDRLQLCGDLSTPRADCTHPC
jgi:hypothetical protein